MSYRVKRIGPGLVSEGTIETLPLLDKFTELFLDLVSETRVVELSDDEVDFIVRVRNYRQGFHDDVEDLMTELMVELDNLAPEGLRFGAHDTEGDGDVFGFWPVAKEGS